MEVDIGHEGWVRISGRRVESEPRGRAVVWEKRPRGVGGSEESASIIIVNQDVGVEEESRCACRAGACIP